METSLAPRNMVARLYADRRVRYVAAGGVAAVIYYGAFSGIYLLAGSRIPYLAIVLMANVIYAVSCYPIYRKLVFEANGPWLKGFFKFYTVSLWSLAYNLLALPFLVEIIGLNVLIAQAIVMVTGPLISYQFHRLWAFKKPA